MRPFAAARTAAVLLTFVALTSTGAGAQDLSQWRTDFSRTTVDIGEIVSGGPPKDGIPALDRPTFETVSEADDWLGDREPVAVFVEAGEVHAYPLQILIWHEIVNDEVGGRPVSVTFCPLCNTTLAFDRRFEGQLLDFGTTGLLRFSDMVMYDRQTETWWQQATGEGIVGEWAGKKLTQLSSPVLSWAEVRSEYPGARVLSRETGYSRRYGENPYRGYDTRSGPYPGMAQGITEDGRLRPMDRVVVLAEGGASIAVHFDDLAERRVVSLTTPAGRRVIFWTGATASALDQAKISSGRAIGTVTVFTPWVDGRALSFEAAGDDRFRDRETRSLWSVTGRAVSGDLEGRQLEPVPHATPFWFAWVAFEPDTDLWGR